MPPTGLFGSDRCVGYLSTAPFPPTAPESVRVSIMSSVQGATVDKVMTVALAADLALVSVGAGGEPLSPICLLGPGGAPPSQVVGVE